MQCLLKLCDGGDPNLVQAYYTGLSLLQCTILYVRLWLFMSDEHVILTKNCLVLTSPSLDFVRLAIALNRIGRCL